MKTEDILRRAASTKKDDVALDTNQLKTLFQFHQVFILAEEALSEVSLLGCKSMPDLTYWNARLRMFSEGHVKPEDRILFRGMVVDAEDMPDEVYGMTQALVLAQEWSIEIFQSVKEATKGIEKLFGYISDLSIEDVTVIIGRELSEEMKSKIHEKSSEVRRVLEEEDSKKKPTLLPANLDINPLTWGHIG